MTDLEQISQQGSPVGPGIGVVLSAVDEPVPLDLLPLRLGATLGFSLPLDVPVKLLNADPRRAYVTVNSQPASGVVRIGRSRTEVVEASTVAILHLSQPMLRIVSTGELWALSTANPGPTPLSVLAELWSS